LIFNLIPGVRYRVTELFQASTHQISVVPESFGGTGGRIVQADESGTLDFTVSNQPPVTIISPSGFVKAKTWNLVSVPFTPVDPDPAKVFAGIDLTAASFQFWTNQDTFQNYGNSFGWTGPIVRGVPYWFIETKALVDKTITYSGYSSDSDFEWVFPAAQKAPYWVMLGTPFDNAVPVSSIQFKDSSLRGDQWLSWHDAYSGSNTALRFVDSSSYGWDAVASQFVRMGPSEWGSAKQQMDPWWGYWMLIWDSGEIRIKVPKP
jgi:hypothetical protein